MLRLLCLSLGSSATCGSGWSKDPLDSQIFKFNVSGVPCGSEHSCRCCRKSLQSLMLCCEHLASCKAGAQGLPKVKVRSLFPQEASLAPSPSGP